VVVHHQHRLFGERSGQETVVAGERTDNAGDQAGERAGFEHHMLVQDVAAQRLDCPRQDVPGQPEHHGNRQADDLLGDRPGRDARGVDR
jgi:hypothetical protein